MFTRTRGLRFAILSVLLASFASSNPINRHFNTLNVRGHSKPLAEGLPLRVLFQGGDVSSNAMKVLMILNQIEPLPTKEHVVALQDSVVSIYAKHLDLPKPTLLSLDLAGQINKRDYWKNPPVVGEIILYPDADLDSQYVFSSYDSDVPSERAEIGKTKATWGEYIKKEEIEKNKVRLRLKSFAVVVLRSTSSILNESIDALTKLTDQGIRIETAKVDAATPELAFGVRLQGRDVFTQAEQIIKLLVSNGVTKLIKHTVKEGDTLDSIYKDQLGMAGSFTKLAISLNKNLRFDPHRLKVGDELLVPDVKFQTFRWTKRISLDSIAGRQELSELQSPSWKHLMPEVIPSERVVRVSLLGYELTYNAPNRSSLETIYKSLSKITSAGIRLSFPSLENEKIILHSFEEPITGDAFWNQCCSGPPFTQMKRGVQGFIGSYIDMPHKEAVEAAGGCEGTACPDIVLIDKNIKPHPDIAGALIDEQRRTIHASALLNETNNTQTLTVGSYVESNDHGTHLAGIIASKDNDFGLVGINPYARIFPVELDSILNGKPFALDDLVNGRASGPFQIYVFASKWSTDDKPGRDRAKVLEDVQPLFIAAAGHSEGQESGISISEGSTVAPMSLGMSPNIVIVTGCNPCSRKSGQQPRLDVHANFSAGTDKYVHIAAPMYPIPSTLSSGAYGAGGGTSQAAALVAGVASLMSSGFPIFYANSPARIKFRLLITSRPDLPLEDSGRLSGGILDPTKALLNPEQHYLAGTDGNIKVFKPKNWCVPSLALRTTGSATPKTIPVNQIYRLFRNQEEEWVIYYSEHPRKALVQKAGPGVISEQITTLMLNENGEPIQLEEITDLLLAGNDRPVVGPCNQ